MQRDELEARATRDVLPDYAFTPDSKALIISYGGKIHRLELASGKDSVITFTADVAMTVEDRLDFPVRLEEGPVRARIAQRPSVSPDGGKAVFSAMTRVYVSELATGTTQRLTHVDTPREFQPVWSPNGGAIAFVTWSENGGEVWKAADAALTQLTKQTAYYHDPVWTPDGSGVVVMRARTQDRRANAQPPREDVVLIRDGEVQRIAVADGLGSPHFAKEVDRVYLYSAQQGLVSVKLDGTDKRQEVKPNGAQEIRAGPDGLHAVERFNNELYLFERWAAQTFDLKAAKRLTLYGADSFAWAGPRTVTWGLGASLFRFDLGLAGRRRQV